MLALDGVQQGFDSEGRKKDNKLRKQNRITVHGLRQPAALFFSLYLCVFTPHAPVGDLSCGSLKLGVSGPVKLDPSDDKRCPGAREQVLQREGSGAPRRDLQRYCVLSAHSYRLCTAHTRQPAPRYFFI